MTVSNSLFRRRCQSSGESSSLRWPRRRRGRGRGSGPRRPPYTTWRTTKSRYRSAVPGVRVARFQHGCYFWQNCSEMQQQQAQLDIMYSSRFTEGTCQMPPRLLSRRSTTSSSSPHWTKVRERTSLLGLTTALHWQFVRFFSLPVPTEKNIKVCLFC